MWPATFDLPDYLLTHHHLAVMLLLSDSRKIQSWFGCDKHDNDIMITAALKK